MLLIFLLANKGVDAVATQAEEAIQTGDEALELAISEEDSENISDEELTEAEPSALPEVVEDEVLTKKYEGRMLLDVEGSGEVYYIDPTTGGKEYLADGSSAHRLLERRALGISEANFLKLTLGQTKDEASVCETSDLGKRLKGKIVLRTEAKGEAYWIYPVNCRAYYAGTHEVAYELMKKFSLGMKKETLAKIKNNARQDFKKAFRYTVYAYAQDNNVSLEQAKEAVKTKRETMKTCMKEAEVKKTKEEKIAQSKICAEKSGLPVVDEEKREEIRETIKEVRIERLEKKINRLENFDIKKIIDKAKEIIKNRNKK